MLTARRGAGKRRVDIVRPEKAPEDAADVRS